MRLLRIIGLSLLLVALVATLSTCTVSAGKAHHYYVTNYGTHCDGVNDDAPHIQACIDDAVAHGVTYVYFPAGNYYLFSHPSVNPDCGGAVHIPSGIRLRGEAGTVVYYHDPEGQGHTGFVASEATDISIEDMVIYGGGTENGNGSAIKLYACDSAQVLGVTVHDFNIGISLYSCQDSTVSDCVVYNVGMGYTISESNLYFQQGSNVLVSGCEAYACDHGFSSKGYLASERDYSGPDARADGKTYSYCYAHDNEYNFYFRYASNATLDHCTSEDGRDGPDGNVLLHGVATALVSYHTYVGTGGTAPYLQEGGGYGVNTNLTVQP